MVFSNNLLMGAGGQASSAYEIDQSIRFNDDDSSHLSKTFGSAGNRKTWTLSWWVKRGNLGIRTQMFAVPYALGVGQFIFEFGDGDGGDPANNKIIFNNEAPPATALNWDLDWAFGDPAAWYHFVAIFDTTQSTANNRFKVYINGAEVTEGWDRNSTPDQNTDYTWNNALEHKIGGRHYNTVGYFDGYMAEIHFIDGTAKAATDFGEYDSNGVWIPKEYSGSYGTTGFFIDGRDSSDLGDDESGNGNDFSSSGLTTADQVKDTPTKNWCVWNNIDTSYNDNVTSDGNLVITTASPGYTRFQLGTFGVTSGKWEWKWIPTASLSDGGIGVDDGTSMAATGASSGAFSSQSANGVIYRSGGTKLVGGTASSYGASFAADDVIRVQLDLDSSTKTIEFFKNDSSQGTINLNNNVTYFPCQFSADAGLVTVADFGQSGFTAATGFNLLNTSNLSTPTIKDGSKHFDTKLWTGNDTDGRAITGYNFQPDWVWIKSRSGAYSHSLTDAVRGVGKYLQSNTTDSEVNGPGAFGSTLAFTSDGYTLDNGTSDNLYVNAGSETYVGWSWKANGSGSSNEDGSINTTATSANTTAGFSISTYTGTGSAATIGHGLGVTPSMILVKKRDSGSDDAWVVWHTKLPGANYYLNLNDDGAEDTSVNYWNNTLPTSSVFSVGASNGTNQSSKTFVVYCFTEIESYSKISSYVGNGNADGPFVYTGFRPAFIIFKNISASSQSWEIFDNKRDGFNDTNRRLYPNASDAEPSASERVRLTSNGFKLVTSGGTHVNGSGNTIIYMAFAEHPFGGDGVAPVTAR